MVQSNPAPVKIQIGGNVDGNIVVGNNNFVVNTNHGTIVYKQAAPQVRPRDFVPQPPRAPRGFINRAAELQKLESWISANEMVLIHAPDGMGKSALLRQAANSQVGRARANGVILLEGVNINEEVLGPNDVIQHLFDALFESVPPLKVDFNTARTYLSNTRPLLLLDEVSLSPALQNSLPDLFPNGAMIFTSDVVTGREDFLRLPLGPLQREVAARLLVNKSGLELNEQNKSTFDSICALLEDISLGVVITGNVIRETGITLDDTLQYFQKISSSNQTGLDRAYLYAFNRLKPEEQNILSTAAITPGVSMSPEWLVAAFGSQEAEQCIERLKALGLLVANSPRLRIPPGIRIPAQRASILDENTVLRRLTVFLLASLQSKAQNWDFFSNELGNLFGALTWTIRTNHWHLALQLGLALDPYLTLRGLWDTWQDVLDFLLEATRQSGNRAAEAFVLHQSGVREIGVGARQKALDLLYQSLRIRQALGDTIGMAYTQHNIDFLIGPPPPPRTNQPEPHPSAPAGGSLPLAASAFSVLAVIGLVLLWFFIDGSGIISSALTPIGTIISTNIPTGLPTDTPSSTPTDSPTPTATPTPSSTLTQVIPFLGFGLTYSTLEDTAFLYQGLNSDYFEVPFMIRMSNLGAANISAFSISIHYEAYDGSHPARFRFNDQGTYSDSQNENGIAIGQLLDREVRVMIPRAYENTEIRLSIQVDRCQIEIQCTMNSLSYSLPQIVYDFIDSAPSARWRGYNPPISYLLEFNGAVTNMGSVRLDQNLRLEDAFQPQYALYTRPPWVDRGGISGFFDLRGTSFAEGDRLFVRVGFLDGAGGDGATFIIVCSGIDELFYVRAMVYDSYDRIVRGLNAQLPTEVISGNCPSFEMGVAAGPTSNSDLTVWLSAYIARFRAGGVPPPPATSTSPPASVTPTPSPSATPSLTSFPPTSATCVLC